MQCPVDNETLVMADRNGVEIDYCPKCRGVWLDRGELDKIIDRAASAPAAAAAAPAPQARAPQPPQPPQGYAPDPRYRDDDDYRHGYKRKKRESFLGELFDF
ncbi:zf-TFIIB domain-containing protein [Paragemmobacter straminiformis]|uniref:Zf-TFIIB domain-containing protein n=1 Tax=Paragemmobacter straminiformis TaxID=2045119 RepID=A0A842I8B4_9RHOB|nr:zf-TFIIB domain-containing protein [Gemmobacter straminiformis]MBC2836312.1 zf-TFIIB domain-containing protein [Gemmobacter straminiformis]